MPDANNNPTWDDYVKFWQLAQQSQERTFQTNLSETQAERQQRLTIANNQLKAQREQIAISQGQAEADRWYKEQQVGLLQREAALNEAKFIDTSQFQREQLGAQTGLGLLNLRAGLKGPGDWAQFLDVGEGFDTLQPSSGFLGALAKGQTPKVADVAFGGAPTPQTLAGLAATPPEQQQARLNADLGLAGQIASNPGKVAQGQLSGIGQDRLQYLLGLAGTKGYSAQGFLDAANKAGIGQGNPFAY